MSVLLEALNLAGSIGAVVSWPPLLVIALVYMALRSGGYKWRWLYALLVVSFFGYATDLADRFGVISAIQRHMPLVDHHDCVIRNDRVVLDGASYEHCTFEHVTLVYDGGHFAFTHNNLMSPIVIASNDPRITAAIGLLNGLNLLKGLTVLDKNGRPIPPGTQTVPAPTVPPK